MRAGIAVALGVFNCPRICWEEGMLERETEMVMSLL